MPFMQENAQLAGKKDNLRISTAGNFDVTQMTVISCHSNRDDAASLLCDIWCTVVVHRSP